MNQETLKLIIEKMRVQGLIVNTVVSSYVNAMMWSNQMLKVYMLLEKENLIILLRAIATQYLRYKNGNKILDLDLKLDVFERVVYDKDLYEEKITKIFIACMKEDTVESCETFVSFCNIINKYNVKL